MRRSYIIKRLDYFHWIMCVNTHKGFSLSLSALWCWHRLNHELIGLNGLNSDEQNLMTHGSGCYGVQGQGDSLDIFGRMWGKRYIYTHTYVYINMYVYEHIYICTHTHIYKDKINSYEKIKRTQSLYGNDINSLMRTRYSWPNQLSKV